MLPRIIVAGLGVIITVAAYMLPFSGDRRVIALTFDDGPRSEVLFGTNDVTKMASSTEGLVGALDSLGVTASFFVQGWKTDSVEGAAAIRELVRRGHAIENHTYGHGPFKDMEKKNGRTWVMDDIERASSRIDELTGRWPKFLRPPEWEIWPSIKEAIEAKGYTVMAKATGGIHLPKALEDVDCEDYRLYPKDSDEAAETLVQSTLKKIRSRERLFVEQHILVFHELPVTVKFITKLIPIVKAEGYEILPLEQFMEIAKTE